MILKFELTCSTEKQSINLNTDSMEQKKFTVTQYHVETNWTPGRGPELRAPASRPVRDGKTSKYKFNNYIKIGEKILQICRNDITYSACYISSNLPPVRPSFHLGGAFFASKTNSSGDPNFQKNIFI